MVKHLPAMQETWVQSQGWKDPLEKAMAPHSSTLAWKIPWTEEPVRLQSTGLQRVGHDWATSLSLSLQVCMYVYTASSLSSHLSMDRCFLSKIKEDAAAAAAKSLQPCPTLCDPIDGSLPGSPVPGILQARTLEWVAIMSSLLKTYYFLIRLANKH